MIPEIESQELQSRLSAGDTIELIDIRSSDEVARGVLPAARHIPMHLIPLRISEFPKDKEIILYCRSGARSYHACNYLRQQGYGNVVNLRGGILGWARNGFQVAPRLDG